MNEKERIALIEKYENEFIDYVETKLDKRYMRWFNNAWGKMSDEGELTKDKINKIVDDIPIKRDEYLKIIFTSYMIAMATQFIDTDKAEGKQADNLRPFLPIAAAVSLTNPKKATQDLHNLSDAVVRNDDGRLDDRLKKGYQGSKRFFNTNREILQKHAKSTFVERQRSHKKIKKGFVDDVWNSYQKKSDEIKPSRKMIEEIAQEKSPQDRYRVKRIIDTEAHEDLESGKRTAAKQSGLRTKTWVTQQDSKVRDTHQKVHNKTLPIDKKFKVGKGKAMYAGDPNLPVGERVNCRCTLRYR